MYYLKALVYRPAVSRMTRLSRYQNAILGVLQQDLMEMAVVTAETETWTHRRQLAPVRTLEVWITSGDLPDLEKEAG